MTLQLPPAAPAGRLARLRTALRPRQPAPVDGVVEVLDQDGRIRVHRTRR